MSTTEAIEYFARRGLSLLLVPASLFLAFIFVGGAIATTTAPDDWIYTEAGLYLAFSLICAVVGIRSNRLWLAWIAIMIGWLPILLLWAYTHA